MSQLRWCAIWIGLLVACGSEGPTGDAGADAGAPHDGAVDAPSDDAATVDGSVDVDSGMPDEDAGSAPDAGATLGLYDRVLAALEAGDTDPSDLDALMNEVAWGPGWPLVDGERWLFVTRWEGPLEAVHLAGDLEGWEPGVSARSASPVHHFVETHASRFGAPVEGARYKWRVGDEYRDGGISRAYGLDAFGYFGWVRPPAGEARFERFPLPADRLDLPRRVRVRLPAGFVPGALARVLLLHDGRNVFHSDAPFGGWRAPVVLAESRFSDVVAIAVDQAADRMDAYTHVSDRISGTWMGGRAEDYLALLEDDVRAPLAAHYGLSLERSRWAIGGSSLGGLVSLYLAETRPELAGCVIAMSPTLGWGAYGADGSQAMVNRIGAHLGLSVYLDSGGGGTCADVDGDGVMEDSDDSDNYCVTLQLRDHLASLGHDFGEDLFHWHEPGAPHREDAWAARLPRAMDACATGGWVR